MSNVATALPDCVLQVYWPASSAVTEAIIRVNPTALTGPMKEGVPGDVTQGTMTMSPTVNVMATDGGGSKITSPSKAVSKREKNSHIIYTYRGTSLILTSEIRTP